ncbi:VOC family protein [Lujinxingia litoralis]|uniref:VOC family protein n=1 Tax=Lujinxingia litoralis TaxID=2211119 RepID=A0A328CE45_9DELT|nr:VOC family protein [Lujinxingia litoralis]RAL25113.1 VOC family protein [Lujinxingia litoralis]
MPTTLTPALMFEGDAQAAIDLYTRTFDDAELLHVERFGEDTPEHAGNIIQAQVRLAGQVLIFTDSSVRHDFSFTPSLSLFVHCDSRQEVDRIFSALSEGGQVLMPLDTYPFSERFGWCNDAFGVSWQIALR